MIITFFTVICIIILTIIFNKLFVMFQLNENEQEKPEFNSKDILRIIFTIVEFICIGIIIYINRGL
jgi:heme/copper-type cytochrome/quinol oxidase subunit 2